MRINSQIHVFKFNLYRILRRVHRLNLRTVIVSYYYIVHVARTDQVIMDIRMDNSAARFSVLNPAAAASRATARLALALGTRGP
eukprot:COSAG02_NODE_5672_length_4140_cov_2.941351_5_plen_84_part_00